MRCIMDGMKRQPKPSQFWKHVSPEPNTGCWLWAGQVNSYGYGVISVSIGPRGQAQKRYFGAHRIALALHDQVPSSADVVMHTCDVPCCVNPDHLRIGTHAANVADCIAKGRRRYVVPVARRTTHCGACGREKSGDNAYVTPQGAVQCRHCRRIHGRKIDAKRGAAR